MIHTMQQCLIKLKAIESMAKTGEKIAGNELTKIQFQMILHELGYLIEEGKQDEVSNICK